MKVFLSWSGSRSLLLAEALRDWLPLVLQGARPWMSASDIEKGAWWGREVTENLELSKVGILCLTRENMDARWPLFEAGALSKALQASCVCPYLLDLEPTDLRDPLAMFTAATATEKDTRGLVRTINRLLDNPLSESACEETFKSWWPRLERSIRSIKVTKGTAEPILSDSEILRELLQVSRNQVRLISKFELQWFSQESLRRLEALLSRASGAASDVRALLGLLLPDVGEGVREGEIFRWLKKPGDFVRDAEPYVEVMVQPDNGGAVVEITAQASGFLLQVLYPEGAAVQVGSVLALLSSE